MDYPFDMVMVAKRGKALGLSCSRIAREAGIAQATMSRWMSGQACPTWPKWVLLLAALDRLEQRTPPAKVANTSFRGVERARDWPAATAAGVPSQAQPGRAVRAAGHLGRAS